MPTVIIDQKTKYVPMSTVIRLSLLILLGAFISAPIHEFGHIIFYWIQGIPARMSLMKEFPLRNLTVTEYGIGSWGGIFANWCFLTALYVLNSVFTRSDKLGKNTIRTFFIGQSLILFMYGLLHILKGESKGEFIFAEDVLSLPRNTITWVTVILTLILFLFFLKKLKMQIGIKEVLFFTVLFISTLLMIVIVEEIDRTLFWGKYPPIKIGNEQ